MRKFRDPSPRSQKLEQRANRLLLYFAAICIALSVLLLAWAVFAQPLEKRGQCPAGYRSSASYCTPERNEKCVRKIGQCPSNYHQSGDYCCENTLR